MRVNEGVTAPEVRLISENGEQLGIVSREQALAAAAAKGLDLCEISPVAQPPVCRIMDFGKFKYEKARREHEAKKKQKTIQVKEIKLGLKIGAHDFETKVRRIRRFLEKGNKVRVSLFFHGREIAHANLGKRLLDRVIAETRGEAVLEKPPTLEGKQMSLVLAPGGGNR